MRISKPSRVLLNEGNFIQCVACSAGEEELLRDESVQKAFCFNNVQLSGIQTSEDLMQRIAVALNFPSYFGGNWDAFLDMITDLSWNPAPGYVVFMKNADALMQLPSEHLGIFVRLCSVAVARWQSGEDENGNPTSPTPFYFFLAGEPPFCRLIADLLTNGSAA